MPLIDLIGLGHFKDRENAMIAENFAATKNYAAGDYCYFNGTLKKFKTAHAAGAWIGTDAEDAKLAGDVSSLKESINNGFRSIYPSMLFPATAMCRGTAFGATFVDGHCFGRILSDKNIVISGNENLVPYSGSTASMPEGYFSVYLAEGSYTMHVLCGYAEYTNKSTIHQCYFAEKTDRVPQSVSFSNRLMKPNTELSANFNITLAGWYALRLYFLYATPLNFKYWLTNHETSTAAMLLENM